MGEFLNWLKFNKADKALLIADENNISVEGDDLVFGHSNFASTNTFLTGLNNLTKDQLIDIMTNHITQVVSHFKGKVRQWSVVNEYNPTVPNSKDGFFRIIGQDYVEIAFVAARKADPAARLYLNVVNNETRASWNYQQTKPIVDKLKAKELIDAVGFQMHIDGAKPPDTQELIETMKAYGVPVILSSIDINMKDVPGADEVRFNIQKQILKTVVEAAFQSGVCKDIYFWDGYGDRYSWFERNLGILNADPTIFYDDLTPKPAYFAVRKVLLEKLAQK